jgi:hypothetical protein
MARKTYARVPAGFANLPPREQVANHLADVLLDRLPNRGGTASTNSRRGTTSPARRRLTHPGTNDRSPESRPPWRPGAGPHRGGTGSAAFCRNG